MFCGYALFVSCDKWVLADEMTNMSILTKLSPVQQNIPGYAMCNVCFIQCLKAGVKSPRLPLDR